MQIKPLFPILLILFAQLLSTNVYAELDTSKLQQQCNNITPQQRQMAQAAGYDVDSMCSSLNSLGGQGSKIQKEVQTVVPRNSQVTHDERGVIDSASYTPAQPKESDFSGKGGLKHYGYDLFSGIPTTFAPVTDIPIPVDYILGPGDEFQVQLLGKVSESIQMQVNRDGNINFPELGPISVAGLKYSEARDLIKQKVTDQMIGVRAIVSLGELRSIRIFVLGEAFQPGSYTVSSLSTITNALFVSGGVKKIGSLRNIQLKRQGKVVVTLDLYDLLQRGDTANDVRLLPGDVIFIPPVGMTVGIKGEVKRAAIYELKNNQNLDNLIALAGGYSPEAFPNISHITRKNKAGFTTVIDVNLTHQNSQKTQLQNGDEVLISTVLGKLDNIVQLSGTFHRARSVEWKKGMRLSDVITSINDFKDDTDLNIGLVLRSEMPLRQVSVHHFELRALLEGDKKQDMLLEPMDEVITLGWYSRNKADDFDKEVQEVFQTKRKLKTLEKIEYEETKEKILNTGEKEKKSDELEELVKEKNIRSNVMDPIIKKLKEQTINGGLVNIVDISGNVRFPGTYPLTDGMTVRDLILLAGGLKEASYLGNAEITRRDLSNQETATIKHINVNLIEELIAANHYELRPKDKLAIYATPEYSDNLAIELEGEVRFPGLYEFKRGETLSQVITRAGGFTSMAHIQAAIFTRDDLKKQETKQLEELKERMREDIAASELENAEAGKGGAIKDAESLLNALTETEALGRLVISLEDIVTGKVDDIQLKNGDRLIIPTFRQEVSVIGEVQHSTSHIFNDKWTLDDYLESSGGLTNRADDDRIYVVRADGSVFLPSQSSWLSHQNEMLEAGDTIVVPLDTDRIKSLTLWTNISQIVYQLALGAAAVTRL